MARSIVAPSALAWTLRTSPTMTPRILTSEASDNWFPTESVLSVTMATSANVFSYVATLSPRSRARTTRNATPCSRRRITAPRLLLMCSPRDPDGSCRSPDGQGEEQVDDVDGHDREPDR